MDTTPNRTEMFLRYLRRLNYLCAAAMTSGLLYAGLTLWGREGRFEPARLGLLFLCPLILISGFVWLQISLKGNRYSLKDPDVQVILKDEYRGHNLGRALRLAFFAVMALQMPLAWALSLRPRADSLLMMGAFTIMFGFLAVITGFLFFDRE